MSIFALLGGCNSTLVIVVVEGRTQMGQDLLNACIGWYISNSTILAKAMVTTIAIAMVITSHIILSHSTPTAFAHLGSTIEPPVGTTFLVVVRHTTVYPVEHIEVLNYFVLTA